MRAGGRVAGCGAGCEGRWGVGVAVCPLPGPAGRVRAATEPRTKEVAEPAEAADGEVRDPRAAAGRAAHAGRRRRARAAARGRGLRSRRSEPRGLDLVGKRWSEARDRSGIQSRWSDN